MGKPNSHVFRIIISNADIRRSGVLQSMRPEQTDVFDSI
jgi:hypothetical protein